MGILTRDDRAFARELRGTLLLCLAMLGIIAAGGVASAAITRELRELGPGISIVTGPGWGVATIGPRGSFSSSWERGDSLFIVSVEDPLEPDDLLAAYVDDVFGDASLRLTDPEPIAHTDGEALRQGWTAQDGGRSLAGELTAVTAGAFGVVIDVRWPSGEEASVIAELRRVAESLRIEPWP